MARSSYRVACVLALGIVALSRCGGGGGGSSTPTAPSTPAAPTVTGLTVTGPTSAANPGATAQFVATALMSNSTTQTVTSQAVWQSSNGAVASVSGSGTVTAIAAGEADIRGHVFRCERQRTHHRCAGAALNPHAVTYRLHTDWPRHGAGHRNCRFGRARRTQGPRCRHVHQQLRGITR